MGLEQDIDKMIDKMEQDTRETEERIIGDLLSQGYLYCRCREDVEQTLVGTNYIISDFVQVGSKRLVLVVVK